MKIQTESKLWAGVRKNFDKWDTNGNMSLEPHEVDKAAVDPSVKGEDAVALASLHTYLAYLEGAKNLKSRARLSEKQLAKLESGPEPQSLDYVFDRLQEKLVRVPQALFVNESPDLDGMVQGQLGSCGFLATLYSFGFENPEEVKSMIKEEKDGTFSVTFPGESHTVKVAPPTDTEIAYMANSTDGTWLTVIEKAWSQHLQSEIHPERKRLHPLFREATYPSKAFMALNDGFFMETDLAPIRELGKEITYMKGIGEDVKTGKPVVVATPPTEPVLEGVKARHAYSLISVNEEAQSVIVRNPHGHGEPVDENGLARDGTDDGKFALSYDELFANFNVVFREVSIKDIDISEFLRENYGPSK